ncbi:hypothetical protein EWM64_g10864, partial [Hericium alpestre]
MSHYPEPDEAQRGNYNDGYTPYPTHNPYDQQQQQYPDPYSTQPHPLSSSMYPHGPPPGAQDPFSSYPHD